MHSILFHIGPVPIRAYGLMLWVALVVGLIRTVRAARRTNIKPDQVVDIAVYGTLAGIIGAHVVSILLDLSYYLRNPSEILTLWTGILSPSGGLRGLSFHGALLGAIGVTLLYTRRKGIRFLEMADLCAPGLALGYAITRIGCFLNGCCYGIATSLPWAVRFYEDPLSGTLTPPSHPTQLYAMAANLLIYIGLVAVDKRRRFTGHVFLSYLVLYSAYRFLIEFLRNGVTAEVAFAGLTEAQVASLAILVVVLPLLVARLRSLSHEEAAHPARQRQIHDPQSAIRNRKGG